MEDLMRIPEWVVVRLDGSVVAQGADGADHPTRFLGEQGSVLAFQFGPLSVVVAAHSLSRISWLTTVEGELGGVARRLLGPGIEQEEGGSRATRLWLDPARRLVALTDGPVEQVEAAIERLRAARTVAR